MGSNSVTSPILCAFQKFTFEELLSVKNEGGNVFADWTSPYLYSENSGMAISERVSLKVASSRGQTISTLPVSITM